MFLPKLPSSGWKRIKSCGQIFPLEVLTFFFLIVLPDEALEAEKFIGITLEKLIFVFDCIDRDYYYYYYYPLWLPT